MSIPQPNTKMIVANVRGVPPGLMLHPMGPKARKQLEDSMKPGKTRLKKPDKDPLRDYREALDEVSVKGKKNTYWMNALAFKNAMIRAAKGLDGVTMTDFRGAVWVDADAIVMDSDNGDAAPTPAIYIQGTPVRDTRPAKNKSGIDIRTRVRLTEWTAELRIFVRGSISVEQALTCLVNAGDGVGVGDWRVEKNGVHGKWIVEDASLMDAKAVA